jgi:hypothetical protein
MSLNVFLRNEWQPVDVTPLDTQTHVSVSATNCYGKINNETIMVKLSFILRFDATNDPLDFANVSLNIGLLDSVDKIRLTTIMTYVDDTGVRFSNAMVEFESEKLVCTAFPFLPNRNYEINTQFFYRVP